MSLKDIYNAFTSNIILVGDKYDVENFSFDVKPLLYEYIDWPSDLMHKANGLAYWYMKGDRDDLSIIYYMPEYEYAMNKTNPFFNSNYGYYMFVQNYVEKCVRLLSLDEHSRRACFMINNNDVAFSDANDKLCTNAIAFRIINRQLNMTVQMRSNHFIDNMPYDMYTFHILYAVVYRLLLDRYKDLQIGNYHHTAISMHINKSQLNALLRHRDKYYNTNNLIIDYERIYEVYKATACKKS